MTATIARHEFLQLTRDGRFRWSLAIVWLLLLAAVASGWRYQRIQAAEKAQAREVEQARWLGQGAKNPHSAAHYGVYVFKPVSPLVVLEQGIEPYVGASVWLEAHNMNDFVHRPAQDTTSVARLGELTAAVAVQVLLPLLVVLLVSGSFAAERETGILRQVLAAGVPARQLATAKLLGTILVPAAILATMAVSLRGAAELPGTGGRLALLFSVYLAYLLGWIFLSLAVSARAATARRSLAALLGCWVLACLILPRWAGHLAAQLHPEPSRAALENHKAQLLAPAHGDRGLEVRDRVLKQYGVTRPEDLPIDWRGISLQEGEELNYPAFDQVTNELFDLYGSQDRVLQQAGAISPLLAVQSLSLALTGTDTGQHRAFVFAAERQRRLMQEILNGDVTLHDREGTDYRAGPGMWAKIPALAYQPPSLRESLAGSAWAALLLAGWLMLTALAAFYNASALKP